MRQAPACKGTNQSCHETHICLAGLQQDCTRPATCTPVMAADQTSVPAGALRRSIAHQFGSCHGQGMQVCIQQMHMLCGCQGFQEPAPTVSRWIQYLACSKEGLHGGLEIGLHWGSGVGSRGSWGHLPHAGMCPGSQREDHPWESSRWHEALLGHGPADIETIACAAVGGWVGGRWLHVSPPLRCVLLLGSLYIQALTFKSDR